MPEIVRCRNCGRETYREMRACPHCSARDFAPPKVDPPPPTKPSRPRTPKWPFVLIAIVIGFPWLVWILFSYEIDFYKSDPQAVVIYSAFKDLLEALDSKTDRYPRLELEEFVLRYGVGGDQSGRIAVSIPPMGTGCWNWWWPWNDCFGISTTKAVYQRPQLRAAIDAAIRNPCAFLVADGSWTKEGEENRLSLRRTFACAKSETGNPFSVGVRIRDLSANRKVIAEEIKWYEATR